MDGQCGIKELCGKQYHCPFELTLQLIGGKWKPLVLYKLGREGTLRFSELRRNLPGVTQKMLTQQLRELETDGLVLRKVYAQVPPKVEYSLSDLGRTIMPVLEMLCEWGRTYEVQAREKAEEAAGAA
ncbi:MAG: helix-turn-helix domain-containing protein [Desulfovibrionaceae bacterium]